MSKYNAIWLRGKDLEKVNLSELKSNGINVIFLNSAAFNLHGTLRVERWIKKANTYNINIHIWVQIFYKNGWINPTIDNSILNEKLKEVKQYASFNGVTGINLDYIRFPGTAKKYPNAESIITDSVKQLVEAVKSVKSDCLVSGSIMPEPKSTAYGQNAIALSEYLDILTPMVYKGNYKAGASWIGKVSKWYKDNCPKAYIMPGLQTYKSDNDTTKLSSTELLVDANTALTYGADGVALFRYGLMNNIQLELEGEVNNKMTDMTWDETKLGKDIFKLAIKVVNKFIKDGGKPVDETMVTPLHPSPIIAFQYWRYKEMLNRWNNYIAKNGREPNYIYIKPVAVDVSGDDKILPIATVLDMEKRVIAFLSKGNKPADTRRIYLDYSTRMEYVTYTKYKDMIARVISFRKAKNRNPNYVYIITQSNSNSTTRPEAVGDDLTPNGDGWYLSQRYKKSSSAIKQETLYWCGPNSIQQLLYELTGKWFKESYIAKVAGTTTSGTGPNEITSTIIKLCKNEGLDVSVVWQYYSDLGSDGLGKLIKDIKTGALQHLNYKYKWGHYEYPIGINPTTKKILVANSLSGGWLEYRSLSTNTSWLNAMSGKSICTAKLN
jgi:uncharacterized DUF497 family protein